MPPDFATLLPMLDGGVFTVTLNRPAVKNAMSFEMVRELRAALDFAERDTAVRILVLRGAGGTFCAGGDVTDMARVQAAPSGEDDPVAAMSREFGELCAAFSNTGLPVIALVEGAALGGGLGLVCVSDIAIAAPDARFGLPETSLGLVPAQIAPFLVERLGYSQAKRLAVMGGFVEAREALAIGLVHEIVDDADGALAVLTQRILKCAPDAVTATKALVREARFAVPEAMIGRAADLFSAALRGAEGQEGTRAFVEKRKPSWAEASQEIPSSRSRREGARKADEGQS